jgi:glycosyltransferase involved in cell wall biosynthesis
MRRVSVLHVMNNFDESSISRIVMRLIENLGSGDISWHIGAVTNLGHMQGAFEERGCRVADFAANGAGGPRRSIRSYVREHGIDIVHTHTPRTIVDGTLALRGPPGVKHVATKHLLYAPSDRRWGLAYALIDRLTLYLPDVVVAVSGTMRAQISKQPLINPNRIVLIRNAIPVEGVRLPHERIAERGELGLPADALVLGYAGRIDKVKRIDLLLKAFREVLEQFPRTRLVIAGEGSLTEEMKTLAEALGVSHALAWPGFYEMRKLLAVIDIYIQPSDNEGLSLSILEAMAAQRAIIATSVGAAREVISDGETGILVPPGSSMALADAVLRLLHDPNRRAAISQAARVRVESEFELGKMVEGYAAVYSNLADAAAAGRV